MNWFGVKVGLSGTGVGGGGGVGKYLSLGGGTSLKRPAETAALSNLDLPEESKKKRKIGFGNFDAW